MGALPKQPLGKNMGHHVSDDSHLLWFYDPLHGRREVSDRGLISAIT